VFWEVSTLRDETTEAVNEGFFSRIVKRAAETAKTWNERAATERTWLLKAVIERVVIHPAHVEIRLNIPVFVTEILGTDLSVPNLSQIATIKTGFRHVQQGRALRLIVGNTNITTDASRIAILKAIARARLWYEQVANGEARGIVELARMHDVSPRSINVQMKLVQLSPRLIESWVNRPESLPLALDGLLAAIPMKWAEQTLDSARWTT
jgi:hypothetical protein